MIGFSPSRRDAEMRPVFVYRIMSLRSCPYCGRIHPKGFDCGKRPIYAPKGTASQKFRKTQRWKDKSLQIRERDHFMCVYCMQHDKRVNTADIEVHHIIPINVDYDRRLDDDNLISLCREHHEQAESGLIKRDTLIKMVKAIEVESNSDLICL